MVFFSITLASAVLGVCSSGSKWLIGEQHEPYYSWAVGSGRIKIWLAEDDAFEPGDWWARGWYRGLDGDPLRWDFDYHHASTGGITVVAIPFWFIGIVALICGLSMAIVWSRLFPLPRIPD